MYFFQQGKTTVDRLISFLNQRIWKMRLTWGWLFLIIGIFALLLLFQKEIALQKGTDDMIFYERTNQISYLEWMKERYFGWSGRIMAETSLYIFLHLSIWVEKVVNAVIIMLFAYTANRLFKKNVTKSDFLFVLCLFGFIAQRILTSSTFAFHAAPNYFWPIVFGLFSFIPIADIFFGRETKRKGFEYFLYGTALIIAVFSNEQILLVLCGFFCSFLLYHRLFLKKAIPWHIYMYGVTLLVALGNMLIAPGNSMRYTSEITRWYPEFSHMEWAQKLERGLVWFYKKFFSEQRYLVLFVGTVTCVAYWRELKKRNFLLEGLVAFSVATLFMKGIKDFDGLLFDFDKSKDFLMTDIWIYLYWSVYLILLAFSLIKIDRRRFMYVLILFAGIASMFVMFVSPTIYASANRILLMNSILMILLINAIRIHFEFPIKKYLFILIIFATTHLAILFMMWEKKGFHIYY